MDKENKPELPQEDGWLDEILKAPELGEELGMDTQAVEAAGLTDPADMQVERIIQEVQLEEALEEVLAEAPAVLPEELLPEELEETMVLPEIPAAESRDNWLETVLAVPELGAELGADEQAVDAAGLLHPVDAQVEQIIQELKEQTPAEITEATMVMPQVWDTEPVPQEEEPAQEPREFFQDEEFTRTFGDGQMLSEVFEEEAPAEEPPLDVPAFFETEPEEIETEPKKEKPVKKRRPHRKKGYGLLGIPHILATLIWLAIAVTIGVTLGRLIWVCASDVLAFGRESQKVSITIEESDDMEAIAAKLQAGGLIKYPQIFLVYADITDAREEIEAGTYELDTIYDYNALVNFMSASSAYRDVVTVLIPEGYTCAQIFKLLEEKGVCTAAKLEEYAANGELADYWFLEGVPRGDKYCLEGYLFPDTYDFYVGDDPGRVLTKLLGDGVGGFKVRFTDVMREKLDALNTRLAAMMKKNGYDQTYIDQHKVTAREVVIVASMIEKETSGSQESFTIASVIYNRLTNQKEYPYLNIDATLIYALGEHTDKLTDADKKVDSPYNTYTNKGLIPGPISNPGTSSLNAALDPDDTGYYFYVYDPSQGFHIFAKTYKEHQKNVDKVG